MGGSELREYASDAIRHWEPRRIVYNVLLASIVIFYHFRYSRISVLEYPFDGYLFLILLAVLANVAYCAAYPVDMFAQASGFRDVWRRNRRFLFAIGLTFAGILTRFMALAMFEKGGQPL
jgi:hypothetical protein